jgi:hypothetical protein
MIQAFLKVLFWWSCFFGGVYLIVFAALEAGSHEDERMGIK